MQYLSRLVHFCCPASRNAREEEVEARPNLFTTAVEKAAKKAVYAKRFRSCHIGTNTCRSACPVGLLHLPRQFRAHSTLLEKKTENKIPITFSLSNIRCPCIRISLLGNNVLLFPALSGPSLVVRVEPHRDINSARNMGLWARKCSHPMRDKIVIASTEQTYIYIADRTVIAKTSLIRL